MNKHARIVILSSSLAVAPVLVRAAPAHIEGKIGGVPFVVTQPLTLEETTARLQDPNSNAPAEFGVSTVQSRMGFRQIVKRTDGSAMELTLALPEEMLA